MNCNDLQRLQDTFVDGARDLMREHGRLRPIGFIVALEVHVAKVFQRGELAFIAPDATIGVHEGVATLVLDLFMDPKRLYQAVIAVFPETRATLEPLIALGEKVGADDPYLRVMRPFLRSSGLDEKDIIAATMRHVCTKLHAFACIVQAEARQRVLDKTESVESIPARLADDQRATEIIFSTMETHDFTRMVVVPVHRAASNDQPKGPVTGFGEPVVNQDAAADLRSGGRFSRFLKPLGDVS